MRKAAAHLLRLQARRAALHMSVRELLRQLAGIGETVLIYPAARGRPKARRMLTETTSTQDKLIQIFARRAAKAPAAPITAPAAKAAASHCHGGGRRGLPRRALAASRERWAACVRTWPARSAASRAPSSTRCRAASTAGITAATSESQEPAAARTPRRTCRPCG